MVIMDLILLLSLVVCAGEGSVKGRWLTIGIMKALGGWWRVWPHMMCGGGREVLKFDALIHKGKDTTGGSARP
jgi:hypothetical protein